MNAAKWILRESCLVVSEHLQSVFCRGHTSATYELALASRHAFELNTNQDAVGVLQSLSTTVLARWDFKTAQPGSLLGRT